ncbi:PilW family protein [Thalassotalea crassostreae]|uniref:PilW family protein n=1 Tax=Thalassotalea crassostreae TaxID=1763536 RepID=UPI0008393AC0|nr:prepilin-type N-terminal cleavage/methylation domain-containing protein [Thalassotalea crassostreae]
MKKHISGLTLIELLLAMVLGLIVLSGVIYVYLAVIVSTSDTLKSSKLNSQLMTIMSVVSSDIRRAGYWDNSVDLLPPTQNPFNIEDDSLLVITKSMSDNTAITENTDESGTCILYSYDRNEDGDVDDVGDLNEYYGVRLNNGAVQIRANGSVTDSDNCSNGTWQTISDTDLYEITTLTFNPKGSACVNSTEPNGEDSPNDADSTIDDDGEADCYSVAPETDQITVETREILISLAGQLKSDSEVKAKISQTVRVRNDVVRIR